MEEPGGIQFMGLQRVEHNWETKIHSHTQTHTDTHRHTQTHTQRPALAESRKKWGSRSYNHKELNSASNLNEPGSGFLPRAFSEGRGPVHTLTLAL